MWEVVCPVVRYSVSDGRLIQIGVEGAIAVHPCATQLGTEGIISRIVIFWNCMNSGCIPSIIHGRASITGMGKRFFVLSIPSKHSWNQNVYQFYCQKFITNLLLIYLLSICLLHIHLFQIYCQRRFTSLEHGARAIFSLPYSPYLPPTHCNLRFPSFPNFFLHWFPLSSLNHLSHPFSLLPFPSHLFPSLTHPQLYTSPFPTSPNSPSLTSTYFPYQHFTLFPLT